MDGLLIVDKPLGITSMDAVSIVRRRVPVGGGDGGSRRRSSRAKVGHAGTLDPLASGVLVMAIGKATAFIDRLMATDKRYRTAIDLSAFTATDDREGDRQDVLVDRPPDRDEIEAALRRFSGGFLQRPPNFSAVKVGGRRAYALARSGEEVRPQPRPVHVHAIALREYAWPIVELDIHCAKGFYVRSLARDLGEALGTGGHCASICRTAVGPFTVEIARPLDQLPAALTAHDLMPIARAIEMVQGPTRPTNDGEPVTSPVRPQPS